MIELVDFPNLAREGFQITSPPTEEYNCIAWAAGDSSRWWWPEDPQTVGFWPENAPKAEDVDAFVQAFGSLGYSPCDNDSLEPGYEKVALYADAHGLVQHAARQLGTDLWTSKLGPDEDILHTIQGLTGPFYGDVAMFLRRAVVVLPD